MIIRATNAPETILRYEGDKFIIQHFQPVDGALQENYEARKDGTNGFSKDRKYRRIAQIPILAWQQWVRENPELVQGDGELRRKTLLNLLKKEENKIFHTVHKGI